MPPMRARPPISGAKTGTTSCPGRWPASRRWRPRAEPSSSNPTAPLPYTVLAVLQVVGRQYEDAIASARQAVALAPSDAQAYAALGLVLAFSGEHAEAAAAVERSLRIDPVPPTSDAIVAGLAFSLNGDHGRAIEVLERARAAAPLVDEVHAALAVAYARAGRLDDARASTAATLRPRAYPQRRALPHDPRPFPRRSQDLDRDPRRAPAGRFAANGLTGSAATKLARLDGAEIARLAFGHTWQGHAGNGGPALLQITARVATRLIVSRRRSSWRSLSSKTTCSASAARQFYQDVPVAGPSIARCLSRVEQRRLHLRERLQALHFSQVR